VGDDSALNLADFDRSVEEKGIPEEDYPAAFAQWIAERTGEPAPKVEEVEQDDEWQPGRGGVAVVSLTKAMPATRPESGYSRRGLSPSASL
jgi:hypothetical protein